MKFFFSYVFLEISFSLRLCLPQAKITYFYALYHEASKLTAFFLVNKLLWS